MVTLGVCRVKGVLAVRTRAFRLLVMSFLDQGAAYLGDSVCENLVHCACVAHAFPVCMLHQKKNFGKEKSEAALYTLIGAISKIYLTARARCKKYL